MDKGQLRQPAELMLHRSGAAARRAHISPATLRVWERRYAIVDPRRSDSGQRLYTESDVERLKLLKILVDQGYAIGTVAKLPTQQLIALSREQQDNAGIGHVRSFRWAMVGASLERRVRRWSTWLTAFSAYADVNALSSGGLVKPFDIALVHVSSLRSEVAEKIASLKGLHPSSGVAVFYAFGDSGALGTLRKAAVKLIREPIGRAQFEQVLEELCRDRQATPQTQALSRIPRIFSDRDLERLDSRTSSLACECPSHLSALISQSAAFEAYSDECAARGVADAALHRYLGDIASQARGLFESALQRIAMEEGWALDTPTMPANGG